MTAKSLSHTARTTAGPSGEPGIGIFPQDVGTWAGRATVLRAVRAAAARGCGDSWLNLLSNQTAESPPDDLLVLVGYCYLQGTYHSIDVVRRLDTDEQLADWRSRFALRAEQVRRFRREHRRALTDCLTHALLALWRERHPADFPTHAFESRLSFSLLEPFYLQAQDRIDRAVVLDSMALDD